MSNDYNRECLITRLTTGRDLSYGSWKSGQLAGAQVAQRQMWGEIDKDGRRK